LAGEQGREQVRVDRQRGHLRVSWKRGRLRPGANSYDFWILLLQRHRCSR
jgi:hypothetical protein